MQNLHGLLCLAVKFGNIALHAITEIQPPAFDEEHRRHVDHGLCHGSHVEHRITTDGLCIGFGTLPAEEARSRALPSTPDHNRATRNGSVASRSPPSHEIVSNPKTACVDAKLFRFDLWQSRGGIRWFSPRHACIAGER